MKPEVVLPISTALAFDFIVSGDPANDSLVCGIGTNNLFALEAKYIPTNTMSTSSLIDVSAWGGTSTNATLEIDNMRFYSVQPPNLTVQIAGNRVILSWPTSAAGYLVESTEDLGTTNFWSTMTNLPAVANSQYHITDQLSVSNRFYRLRQE